MNEDENLMKELDAAIAAEKETISKTETVTKDVVDPFLEQALKDGYNPNYDGPDKKTPEQFVKDGSFFKKIKSLKDETDELKRGMKDLLEFNRKIEKQTYEKALSDFKAMRVEAIEQGDVVKAEALDEHIYNEREKLKSFEEQVPQVQQQEVHPAAVAFKDNNPWFRPDLMSRSEASLSQEEMEFREMTEEAIAHDELLGRRLPEGRINSTPEENMKAIEDRIRRLYSHKFENPKKSEPSPVGKSTVAADVSSKNDLVSRMTEHQKGVYEMYKRMDPKFSSIEEYAKTLDKIGDLKGA